MTKGKELFQDERDVIDTSKPIHIGKKVWIGANSTILAGVPCKVIRKITDEDRLNMEEGIRYEE